MSNDITDRIKSVNRLLKLKFGNPPKAKNLPEPIDMLIATILSQNTNDQNSYKAYQNLRAKYSNWDEVNKARRISIEKEIKIAGLGLQKSTAIKNLLKELDSKVGNYDLEELNKFSNSESIEYLSGFKGIGVKTASCVLLFAKGKNICPVDTHVHRTLNRIGIVETKSPDKTFFALNDNFPPKIAHTFHTNLIRLGREICTPNGYACSMCPVEKECNFKSKNFDKLTTSKSRAFMLLDNV